jgi:hypothetical protein
VTFLWSVVSGSVSLSAAGTLRTPVTAATLVIAPFALAEGQDFELQVTATDDLGRQGARSRVWPKTAR